MKAEGTGLVTVWVSFLLSVLVAVTGVTGLFWAPIYAREVPLWATEGRGGDAVNLVLVVPVLLVSAVGAYRGSVAARLVWVGSLLYLLYNFVIYTLAVHFNALFLVYCSVLGLSFYALLENLTSLPLAEIVQSFGQRTPVKHVALVFFLLASLAAAGWLREIVPALLAGHPPQSVSDVGLPTNPVHVLDLSFLSPGLVITAIMLLRRKAVAFALAPALLTFLVLMSVQLAGIVVAMDLKGFQASLVTASFFIALAAGFATLLWFYLRTGWMWHDSSPWQITATEH
jgi:hypothetical protein